MKLDSIIHNRYQLLSLLDRGKISNIYRARDITKNSQVAIKIISLKSAEDWQTLELFEQEATILSDLSHPNIPKYIEYFEIDTQSDRLFCLVREFVEGISLGELVKSNYPLSTKNILSIAQSVLEILVYLQEFNPPLIHRDLKPENLLRTYDGSIYLIDFGAVSNSYTNSGFAIDTFIGTLGYIPPEQFSGQVSTASDLYSLGCVILFLLTKRCPSNLLGEGLRIDLKSTIKLSPEISEWLGQMLEPAIANRFDSAKVALDELLKLKATESYPTFRETMKSIAKDYQKEAFNSPKQQSDLDEIKDIRVSSLLQQQSNTLWINCPDLGYFQPKKLEIGIDTFILYVGNSNFYHPIQGNKADLSVSLIKKQLGKKDTQNICCAIYDGNTFHQFGSTLSYSEQLSLVKGIDEFILGCLNNLSSG